MCDHKLRVAMCSCKLQCAGTNPFWLKLAMCVYAVLVKACEVRLQFRTFYTKKGSNVISNLNDDFCKDFLGVLPFCVSKIGYFRIFACF